MESKRSRSAHCALLLLLLAVRALAFQQDDFVISYWGGPPASANLPATWQTVRDAHFTLCGPVYWFHYSADDNRKMLQQCHALGMPAIVSDDRLSAEAMSLPSWRDALATVFNDYDQNPGLYSYFVRDEPSAASFPQLARVSQEILRRSGRLPYINLLPNWAPPQYLGVPSYREYLDGFLAQVAPPVLSFDHYPLIAGFDRPEFFANLQAAAEAAGRAGIPLWVIVRSLFDRGFRPLTEAEMRWQVYASLLYGAKGILYYTYWSGSDVGWADARGIVGPKGEPTPLYAIVRGLNRQMETWGPLLMELDSEGVEHSGEPMPSDVNALAADSWLRPLTPQPLAFGKFRRKNGERYLLIFNRDYRASASVSLLVSRNVAELFAVDEETAVETALAISTAREISLALPAGGGRLLRVRAALAH